jgi:hypothetical protein
MALCAAQESRPVIYTSLVLPRWLRDGIKPNDRGSVMRKFLYGGDTETMAGQPISFQFYSEQAARDDMLWINDAGSASKILMKWCRSLVSHAQHVVYIHNLEFDLVSFFWDRKEELVSTVSGEFEFECEGWRVTGVYGAPTFAKLTDGSQHRSVFLVDSYSYYRASLAKAAAVFCPALPKLARPDGLGQKRFTKSDRTFVDYAMRDAVVAYHIGVALEDLHQEFDLSQTVSVADMAARIFRHSYLESTIPQPPRAILECGLNSYHGGKNNLSVAPGWYRDVSSLDISSAYPHAMAGFPSFYEESLYKKYSATRPKQVPALGVYRVHGYVNDCAWPCLFAHNFTPMRGESVPGVCVSGYELNEALRSGEFKPSKVIGWFYDAEKDRHDPPLRRFVNEFYMRKEAEKDKPKRAMYKFILNSISGKFIQTRKREKVTHVDIDDGSITDSSDLVAGGMFHPFIASLITGHTRARIHQLEHQFSALHTATDGIFTQKKIRIKKESGLGALVNEAQGDLLLLRNKLYVLYGDAPPDPKDPVPSSVYAGKFIIKAALHGFAGSVSDLEALVVKNRRAYKATRVNRLRSSLKRGMTPNEFREQAYNLKVGLLPVHL